MTKKFTDAWGYSKLSAFQECPAKFNFQFVEKLPTKGSPAMARGQKIHEGIESYLNGWAKELPVEALEWQEAFDGLKKKTFKAEAAWGFDKNWNLLPDWFGKDTWLRAKSDGHYIEGNSLVVLDWKTGKYRVPSTDQVELYAICGGAVYPTAECTTVEMWFIDTSDVYKREYTREELLGLRKKYERYVAPMYNMEVWTPTPSSKCRWCDFSKTKGGPCQY